MAGQLHEWRGKRFESRRRFFSLLTPAKLILKKIDLKTDAPASRGLGEIREANGDKELKISGRFVFCQENLAALDDEPSELKRRRALELEQHVHTAVLAHRAGRRSDRDARLFAPQDFDFFGHGKTRVGRVYRVVGKLVSGDGGGEVGAVELHNSLKERKLKRIRILQNTSQRVVRI